MSEDAAPPLETIEDLNRSALTYLFAQREMRRLARRLNLALGTLRMNTEELCLLTLLHQSEALTVGELGFTLGAPASRVSALISSLIRRSLVVIYYEEGDRRRRWPRLTDNGRDVLNQAAAIWKTTLDQERLSSKTRSLDGFFTLCGPRALESAEILAANVPEQMQVASALRPRGLEKT